MTISSPREQNRVPALVGTSSVDGTPVLPYVDPTTHRLLVDLPVSGGDVVGPASAVDGNVVLFDGITGKLIKDGGVALSGLVPYTGATGDVDLGTYVFMGGSFQGSGVLGTNSVNFTGGGLQFGSGTSGIYNFYNNVLGDFNGILDFSGITTSDKTFTFPDASGTIALTGDLSAYALTNQTMYIGTTAVAINRASAALTLAGITLTTPDIGTPSAGTLTNCGSLPISGLTASTSTALGVGSIELGHASDTTIARVSAGVISVEGANVFTALGIAKGGLITGTGAGTAGITTVGTDGWVLTADAASAGGVKWAASSGGFSPKIHASTVFETAARFNTANVGGSGAITFGGGGVTIDTGATSGSFAYVLWQLPNQSSAKLYGESPTFTAMLLADNNHSGGAAASCFIGLGIITVGAAGNTFIDNHIGFKLIGSGTTTNLYATQGDGSTENASASLTTVASGDRIELCLKVNGSTSVDYYWRKNEGTWSAATNLTTNLPSLTAANSYAAMFSASNNNTAFYNTLYCVAASYER